MKRNIISACLVLVVLAFGQMNTNKNIKLNDSRLSPRLLNYQGYLTDTLNNPITNPAVSMMFSIFDAATVGSQKWTEIQATVSVNKGIFHVLLGSVTAIPDSVFNNSNRWLELSVAGQTLAPRTRIVSAAYAYTSTYADTANYARAGAADTDWVISGSNMYSGVSGNVGIGTASPKAKLEAITSGNGTVAITTQADVDLAVHENDDLEFGFVDSVTGVVSSRPMIIVSSGNVGIGTGINPLGKLDVSNGSLWLSNLGTSVSDGLIFCENTTNTFSIVYDGVGAGFENKLQFNTTLGGGNIMTFKGDGLVGLGTTAPLCKMDVRGIICGGASDSVKAAYGGVLGGYSNLAGDAAADTAAAVCAGYNNSALAKYVFIGGGSSNTASGDYSTISGGEGDSATGYYSAVPGGFHNTTTGRFAFAAGRQAKATHTGTFVWADSTNANFASTGANQFLVRASGGVGINTNAPQRSLHVTDVIRLQPRSSPPMGPAEGDIYMDGTVHILYVYDGAAWRACW